MIIGVEGVSCTGKTTLIARLTPLLSDPLVVPCYYHAAPDPALLPHPVAGSAEEQLRGLADLLGIETLRWRRAAPALARGQTVVLDRTVDTLLAHTHAINQRQGFDTLAMARTMVRRHWATLLPDVTVLLIADPQVLAQRARARPGLPPIFYDPDFTESFNDYFHHHPLARCRLVLDAAQPVDDLASLAFAHIERLGASACASAGSISPERT